MGVRRRLISAVATLDERVNATSPQRNRAADFLRVAAICVVIVWHWALSVTHRRDGQIVNPNPVEHVPGGWLLTWLLQVMPIFFIIGGFANLTSWDAVVRSGRGTLEFLRRRMSRLLLPVLVFVAVWVVVEAALRLSGAGYGGALQVMPLVFTPMWFLGAYAWVTLLVPLTAWLHRRYGPPVAVLLGATIVVVDVARFAGGLEVMGIVNSALVWVLVHQLGYLWKDGRLDGRWRPWAYLVGGYALVALATSLDVYPRSMVAIPSEDISHMWPSTAVIAALAVAQVGLVALVSPLLNRWLSRRAPYRPVVAVGSVLLTVFLWHMTALVITIMVVEALGFVLIDEPTAQWWFTRPFWLIAPAVVLAVLVAIFAPIELRIRRALSLH